MVVVLQALYWVALVAIGVVLIQRYLRTHHVSDILFFLAVPIWPLVSWALSLPIRNQLVSSTNDFAVSFPLSLSVERSASEVRATRRSSARRSAQHRTRWTDRRQ